MIILAHITLTPHDPESLTAMRFAITAAAAAFQLAVYALTHIKHRKK